MLARQRHCLATGPILALMGCASPPPQSNPQTAVPPAAAEQPGEVDLSRHFAGLEGTFVVLDAQSGRIRRHNPARAAERLLPASTFKIPNALIALETGVASGPDFPLAWDSTAVPRQAWWPASWARNHTLRTALPNSVVWYFQEIARRIRPERMQAYLRQFDYGNHAISGGIDHFWLTGDLRISADEQVQFLRRFYTGQLGASPRSTQLVKDFLVLEETPEYRLSGKTGTARLSEGREVGWLVGYVEREGQTHVYALNLEGRSEDVGLPGRRIGLAKAMLGELGILPESQ